VLTKADKVVTVGWDCAKGLGRIGNRNVRVIPNGFDWETNMTQRTTSLTKEFTLTHLGIITPSRNAPQLWAALKELKAENPDFNKNLKIKLIGQIDQSVVQNLKDAGLMGNTEITPYIPHDEIQQIQQSSQVLLLLINNTPNAKGILTGKLFEYLASGRPILCIGPEDGDAARILKETHAGTTIGFDDKDRIKATLLSYYNRYKSHELASSTTDCHKQYSRKNLTQKYASLLDAIISK
jgi:glycosyltransferase involved in cell wall biosynthesis